jgi:deazaflavin-dependent oxidoreductase (nitroreductase family)
VKPPSPALRTVLNTPNLLYRRHVGWLLGHRFVQIEHTGRRSGARYDTVVEVLGWDRGSGEVIVMSGWGPTADWYRNIRAGTPTAISFGQQSSPVVHRDIAEDEAVEVLRRYEERNRWMQAVVRRVLGRLSGQPYDGSVESRRAVIHALPLIALVPVASTAN